MLQKTMQMAVIAVTVGLTSCAEMPGIPGHISEAQSTFDGSVQLSMEPAMVFRQADGFSGADIQLGLLWRSTMAPGELVLVAYVEGAHNFSPGKSLLFNVDGQIVGLEPIDQVTGIAFKPGTYDVLYIPATNVSSKRYLVTTSFLANLLAAKDVRVRLDLGRTFVEGIFSDDTMGSARRAFKDFSQRLGAQTKRSGA